MEGAEDHDPVPRARLPAGTWPIIARMQERVIHRAIGAGVLGLAAAVVLPFALESSPPVERRPAAAPPDPAPAPPPAPLSPAQVRISPLAGGGSPQGAAPAREPSAASRPPASREPSAADGARPAAPGSAGWVVQVGSFAEPGNAAALRDRLAASGFRAFTERMPRQGGKPLTRVLVGPDSERADAAARLERLRRDLDLEGFLAPYPG